MFRRTIKKISATSAYSKNGAAPQHWYLFLDRRRARLSAVVTSTKMEEAAVLIVGAGPSGLALGALLGRMKVKVCTPCLLPHLTVVSVQNVDVR